MQTLGAVFGWLLCLFINAPLCYGTIEQSQVDVVRIGPNIYDARDTMGSQRFRIYTYKCSLIRAELSTLAWNGKSRVLEARSESCTVVRVEALGRS